MRMFQQIQGFFLFFCCKDLGPLKTLSDKGSGTYQTESSWEAFSHTLLAKQSALFMLRNCSVYFSKPLHFVLTYTEQSISDINA